MRSFCFFAFTPREKKNERYFVSTTIDRDFTFLQTTHTIGDDFGKYSDEWTIKPLWLQRSPQPSPPVPPLPSTPPARVHLFACFAHIPHTPKCIFFVYFAALVGACLLPALVAHIRKHADVARRCCCCLEKLLSWHSSSSSSSRFFLCALGFMYRVLSLLVFCALVREARAQTVL